MFSLPQTENQKVVNNYDRGGSSLKKVEAFAKREGLQKYIVPFRFIMWDPPLNIASRENRPHKNDNVFKQF